MRRIWRVQIRGQSWKQNKPHDRNVAAILCLAASLSLASCGTEVFGFFSSESTPDERFEDSRGMAQPADQNFGDSFSFIFVTDLHIHNGAHAYFRGLKDRLDGASFILVGGDITDAGIQEDADEFIAARASLGVPVYSVPGNHDLYDGGWSRTRAIGASSFALELSPDVRLVCLDSANGTLGTEQAEWLSGVLSDAKEPTIIVATHMNFFTAGYDELLQFTSPEEVAMILSMCRSAGVDLSLAGHTHSFDEVSVGDMKTCVGDAFLDDSAASTYLFVTYSGGKLGVERRRY